MTSGAWGHRTGLNLALAFVAPQQAEIGSTLTIENGVVSEFNPFLQRGRIVSSNLASEETTRMRCAANVDKAILYGLSSDGRLYKLELGKVDYSQSGNCQWKLIDEDTFTNRLKFSTCLGLVYCRQKDRLFVYSTCLVDHNKPQLLLSTFDCKKNAFKQHKPIILHGDGEDWLPDVFGFDEQRQRLLVGGASEKINKTMFLSIDVETLAITTLPSILGTLTMGSLLVHPTTNRLYYVGGEFKDRECLPTTSTDDDEYRSFTYYELNDRDRSKPAWKRFQVVVESPEDDFEGPPLMPLCSFPKPYNFIRIHACAFSSGKSFHGLSIDFPIEGRDDHRLRRANVKNNFRASFKRYRSWTPSEFKRQQRIPISFWGLSRPTSTSSSSHTVDGSQTPLRDESSKTLPFRTHILMPVKTMAKWWYSCTGNHRGSRECIVCTSLKDVN